MAFKDSGFVALAIEGSYDVLSIVDQTHLPNVVTDKVTKAILGWYVIFGDRRDPVIDIC